MYTKTLYENFTKNEEKTHESYTNRLKEAVEYVIETQKKAEKEINEKKEIFKIIDKIRYISK